MSLRESLRAGRLVITGCRSGARSARAASFLVGQGHEVANLRGGMWAWVAGGLAVVAKGGHPGAVV